MKRLHFLWSFLSFLLVELTLFFKVGLISRGLTKSPNVVVDLPVKANVVVGELPHVLWIEEVATLLYPLSDILSVLWGGGTTLHLPLHRHRHSLFYCISISLEAEFCVA
jgi:hypothetical protein